MRRKVGKLFFILCCIPATSLAVLVDDPPAFIIGTVTDRDTDEPIPNVNVLIVGTRFGSTTDNNGKFSIGPLKPGLFAIDFSHVSYEKVRDARALRPGDTLICEVRLVKRSILLDPVEVTAEHSISAPLWKGTSGRTLTRKDIEGSGVRRMSDLMRHMAPGAYVLEMGPDLIIDLNRSSRRTTTRSPFRDYPNTNPLIILNGMRIGKSPQSLSLLIRPEEIDEIVVLKGTEAHMYGYEGRDGVILVNTTPELDSSGLSLFEKIFYASVVLGLLTSLLLLL
ncbi:MAG: carboxypeptidase-like regulatory domain-containing protein [Ignavibacteriales bacterium]|nr:carboxypeptidase-like regulatory domain-containing protein [Ignavibacteriales bacterium]